MSIRLVPSLRMVHECSVCLQIFDEEKARTVEITAAIFGSVAFAICPCCRQEAPNMTAKAYLARAARWVQERSLVDLRERLGPCKAGTDGECNFADCPQRKVHLAWCPLWTHEEDA
jgi:hypothetical protein